MLQRHAPLLQLPLTLHDPFLNSRDQSKGSTGEAVANRRPIRFGIWGSLAMTKEESCLSYDHDLQKSFFAKIDKNIRKHLSLGFFSFCFQNRISSVWFASSHLADIFFDSTNTFDVVLIESI
jgi:hypothetical protein